MNVSMENFTIKPPNVTDRAISEVRFEFIYAVMFICISGFICNVLALVTMLYSQGTHSRIFETFLLPLACCDTLLLTTFATWTLHETGFFQISSHWICEIFLYFNHSSRVGSNLIIIFISINRFVAICFPTGPSWMSDYRSAKVQMYIIIFISVVVNGYVFGVTSVDKKGLCRMIPDKQHIYVISSLAIQLVLLNIIGNLTVMVLSLWTVATVWHSTKLVLDNNNAAGSSIRRREDRQVTVTLITLSLSFVLLRLPYTLIWTLISLHQALNKPFSIPSGVYETCEIIELINYALNFVLYSVISRKFRNDLVSLFHCKRKFGRNSSRETSFRSVNR